MTGPAGCPRALVWIPRHGRALEVSPGDLQHMSWAELGTAEVSWVARRVLELLGNLLPSPKATIAVRKEG